MTALENVTLSHEAPIATIALVRPEVQEAFLEGLIAEARSGTEGRAGARAFLEKREPQWTGEGH